MGVISTVGGTVVSSEMHKNVERDRGQKVQGIY